MDGVAVLLVVAANHTIYSQIAVWMVKFSLPDQSELAYTGSAVKAEDSIEVCVGAMKTKEVVLESTETELTTHLLSSSIPFLSLWIRFPVHPQDQMVTSKAQIRNCQETQKRSEGQKFGSRRVYMILKPLFTA